MLTGVGFLGRPCVPSLVLVVLTPKLPLLPLWEKGVRGMRGKSAQGCRKPLITPKNSTFERLKPSAMLCEARLRGLKQMYFLS